MVVRNKYIKGVIELFKKRVSQINHRLNSQQLSAVLNRSPMDALKVSLYSEIQSSSCFDESW
jgi:hypothetical protein